MERKILTTKNWRTKRNERKTIKGTDCRRNNQSKQKRSLCTFGRITKEFEFDFGHLMKLFFFFSLCFKSEKQKLIPDKWSKQKDQKPLQKIFSSHTLWSDWTMVGTECVVKLRKNMLINPTAYSVVQNTAVWLHFSELGKKNTEIPCLIRSNEQSAWDFYVVPVMLHIFSSCCLALESM